MNTSATSKKSRVPTLVIAALATAAFLGMLVIAGIVAYRSFPKEGETTVDPRHRHEGNQIAFGDYVPDVLITDELPNHFDEFTLVQASFDSQVRLMVDGDPETPRLYTPIAIRTDVGYARRDRCVAITEEDRETFATLPLFPVYRTQEQAESGIEQETPRYHGHIRLRAEKITPDLIAQFRQQLKNPEP